jgi:hypothetical protein
MVGRDFSPAARHRDGKWGTFSWYNREFKEMEKRKYIYNIRFCRYARNQKAAIVY